MYINLILYLIHHNYNISSVSLEFEFDYRKVGARGRFGFGHSDILTGIRHSIMRIAARLFGSAIERRNEPRRSVLFIEAVERTAHCC